MQLVRLILERVEAGSEVLAEDLANIRMFFAQGGFFARFLNFFGGFGAPKPTRRKRPGDDITKI